MCLRLRYSAGEQGARYIGLCKKPQIHAYVVLSTLSRTALRLSIVPRPTVRQQSAEQQSVVSVSVARVVSTTGPTPAPRSPVVQAGVL